MAYDESNRGVLFPEREKKNERSPDYTGKVDVNGKVYRLAAWIKAKGVLSISVSDFKAEESGAREGGGQLPPAGDLDSDIPFAPHRGF